MSIATGQHFFTNNFSIYGPITCSAVLFCWLGCVGPDHQFLFPAARNVGILVTLICTNLSLVSAVAVNSNKCVLLHKTRNGLHLLETSGGTSGPTTITDGSLAISASNFRVIYTSLNAAQQEPKLYVTGCPLNSPVEQISAVAFSADGNTLALGGTGSNANTGVLLALLGPVPAEQVNAFFFHCPYSSFE